MATAAPAAVSANRAELIAIADAVAREKLIDKGIVIEAMEDAIQRAARARYGAENDIRAKLDAETGDLRLWRVLEVVEEPEDHFKQIDPTRAQKLQKGLRVFVRSDGASGGDLPPALAASVVWTMRTRGGNRRCETHRCDRPR